MTWTCMPFVGDSSEDYLIAWMPFVKAMARIGFHRRYVHNDHALAYLYVWETPINAKPHWPYDMCKAQRITLVYHVKIKHFTSVKIFMSICQKRVVTSYKCPSCYSSFTPKGLLKVLAYCLKCNQVLVWTPDGTIETLVQVRASRKGDKEQAGNSTFSYE